MSRPYKAYGGVVELSPKESACTKEVLSSPRFAKVEWPLSLLATVKAYRTTGMAGNATDKDWADRRRLIAECMAKTTGSQFDYPDILIPSLQNMSPAVWLIGGGVLLVLAFLIGRAMKG